MTCMTTMRYELDDAGAASWYVHRGALSRCNGAKRWHGSLVVGTEDGRVFVLQPSGTAIAATCTLSEAPVWMVTTGNFRVGNRIVAASRNGKVFLLRVRQHAACTRMRPNSALLAS